MANETSYKNIYDNFLSLVTDDLYSTGADDTTWTQDATYADLEILLENAKVKFFLPKEDILSYTTVGNDKYFTSTLSVGTIDILTLLMIREWLARQMNTVRITETQYTGSDAKAINTKAQAEAIKVAQDANQLELKSAYHRYQYQSINQDTKIAEVSELNLTSGTKYAASTRGKYRGY